MARAPRRPAPPVEIPPGTDSSPPAIRGETIVRVERLEALHRKFDHAAFDHPSVDAVVVFRPDLRHEEAECMARNLHVRVADPASENFAAEQAEETRGTYAALRSANEWVSWDPPIDRSIEQLGNQKYWARVISANEYPEFPGPASCKTLWQCELFGPPANEDALRRFTLLATDSASLIFPLCQAKGKALISLWLIHLANRPEPIVPDSRKQFLHWSTIAGRPSPPMWIPVTPRNPSTNWWAVRLPNVFQLSRTAIENELSLRAAPDASNAGLTPKSDHTPTPDLHVAQAFLAVPDLAAQYEVDQERLRGRLKRWMPTHQNDWREVTDRKPRDPKYMYRVAAVLPIINQLKKS